MAYINFDPQDYFNTVLYTGDGSGSARTITGVGFQPDWLWNKSRSNAYNHYIFDVLRGTNMIGSNASTGEEDKSPQFSAFTSDGFTITNDAGSLAINASSVTFANWCWKANGAGVSNTDGSITSTVSASTTSGFSIVTYTGNGTAGATVGHGLGATPKMMLIKQLNSSNLWRVYHSSLGATNVIYLNSTGATDTGEGSVNFNNTAPSSSVFTLGSNVAVNGLGNTFVAYVFAEKKGFSKFGSYTGNGNADGTFIYTGFKPAFVIIKNSSSTGAWYMQDNKRDVDNPIDLSLNASDSNADNNQGNIMDFLSNGIKIRNTGTGYNSSGATYIYMVFAENPLINSLGNPATAR
jgi:hypothetical protein